MNIYMYSIVTNRSTQNPNPLHVQLYLKSRFTSFKSKSLPLKHAYDLPHSSPSTPSITYKFKLTAAFQKALAR